MPSDHIGEPRLFRSYTVRRNMDAGVRIWEAAHVTNAGLLNRITINYEDFSEAGLGFNNPVERAAEESRELTSTKASIIVSLGAGNPGVVELPRFGVSNSKISSTMIKILRDCETTENRFAKNAHLHTDDYFRFNVEQGMQSILKDFNELNKIKTHTVAYLHKHGVSEQLDQVVRKICAGLCIRSYRFHSSLHC